MNDNENNRSAAPQPDNNSAKKRNSGRNPLNRRNSQKTAEKGNTPKTAKPSKPTAVKTQDDHAAKQAAVKNTPNAGKQAPKKEQRKEKISGELKNDQPKIQEGKPVDDHPDQNASPSSKQKKAKKKAETGSPFEGEVREYEPVPQNRFSPDDGNIEFQSHDERYQARQEINKEHEAKMALNVQDSLNEMNLMQSQKFGYIEEGMMLSIEPYPSGTSALCAVVMYGDNTKVYIPFTEMYCTPLERGPLDTDESMKKRQLELIKGNLFATIKYKVTLVGRDPETGELFATGSRKQAMLKEQRQSYFPTKRRQQPLLQPGNIYEADIIATGRYGILICLGGVDASLSMKDLSYQYMEFAYDRYSVGDKIRVKLISVKKKERGTGVGLDIVVNAKLAEKIDFAERAKGIVVSGIYVARVVVIKSNKNGPPTIYLWLEQAKIPASARWLRLSGNSLPLSKGSLVSLQIDSINKESCDIRGTILRVINNNPATHL